MKIKNTFSFRDVLLLPVRLLGVRMISGPRALNRLAIESRNYDSAFVYSRSKASNNEYESSYIIKQLIWSAFLTNARSK